MNYNDFFCLRNTDRLKKVLHKLHNKETVHVVFLGGSITSGYSKISKVCYVDLFYDWCQKQYPGCNLHFHNMAIPGTPSILGLYLGCKFVMNYNPDLIILEYDINDMKNHEHQIAYESLTYYFLTHEKKPALVSLHAKNKVGYTCENFMDMVFEHYKQPSLFITKLIDEVGWDNYSSDYCHPNDAGHHYICDLLASFFQNIDSAPVVNAPLPTEAFYDNSLYQLNFNDVYWHYEKRSPENTISFTLECSQIYILYYKGINEDYGDCDVLIDGEPLTTLSEFCINSWERLVGSIFRISDEKKEHTITFKVQKGDQSKCFNLHNFGYC